MCAKAYYDYEAGPTLSSCVFVELTVTLPPLYLKRTQLHFGVMHSFESYAELKLLIALSVGVNNFFFVVVGCFLKSSITLKPMYVKASLLLSKMASITRDDPKLTLR